MRLKTCASSPASLPPRFAVCKALRTLRGSSPCGILGAHGGCANFVQDQRFEDRIVWANGLDLAPEFLYERVVDCQNAMATPPA